METTMTTSSEPKQSTIDRLIDQLKIVGRDDRYLLAEWCEARRIASARQGIARLEAIRDKARHGTTWRGDRPGSIPGIPVPRGVAEARQLVANCDRELAVYAQKLAAAQEALARHAPPDGEDLQR
jgi:hypothetical protein